MLRLVKRNIQSCLMHISGACTLIEIYSKSDLILSVFSFTTSACNQTSAIVVFVEECARWSKKFLICKIDEKMVKISYQPP